MFTFFWTLLLICDYLLGMIALSLKPLYNEEGEANEKNYLNLSLHDDS